MQNCFQSFWLEQINEVKLSGVGQDRNKLRLYKKFKGSFTLEPYIELVRNRNQRSSITRMRVSAHHLANETGRWARPKPQPLSERLCRFCSLESIDSEEHFLLHCPTFLIKRNCFVGKLKSLLPHLKFDSLSDESKLATILCPVTAQAVKLVNKFILIMGKAREKIQEGEHISSLTFPQMIQSIPNELNLNSLDDTDYLSDSSISESNDTLSENSFSS